MVMGYRKGNNALGHTSVYAFSLACRLNVNYLRFPRNLSLSLTLINLHVLSAKKNYIGASRYVFAPFLQCLFKTKLEIQIWVLTIEKEGHAFLVLLFVHFDAIDVQSLVWMYFCTYGTL